MAIKTLGSAQKIRVGRESGSTTLIFLGLTQLGHKCSYQWLHYETSNIYNKTDN